MITLFPEDQLMRLLAHEKDMTCSLYLQRQQPFSPIAYSHVRGRAVLPLDLPTTSPGGADRDPRRRCLGDAHPLRGLPGDRVPTGSSTGAWVTWHASEDSSSARRRTQAGFDIFLDLEARLGHMSPSAVWPSWVDQEWAVGFSVADGAQALRPHRESRRSGRRCKEVRSGREDLCGHERRSARRCSPWRDHDRHRDQDP